MSQLLNLFPPGSATDADGMLVIGGCRVDDLAAEFGTPVLVVAEDALRYPAREYAAELTSRWSRACACEVSTPTSAHRFFGPKPLAEAVAPHAALGKFAIYDLGGGLGARYTWADQPPTLRSEPRGD